MTDPTDAPNEAVHSGPEEALAAIRDCLRRIRFGSIALTIHDGRVVQLDVTEKKRLSPT